MQGDADRARKHGMDEYIQGDPCAFNHHQMFRILQNLTLTYRLNEPVVSLGMCEHLLYINILHNLRSSNWFYIITYKIFYN